MNVLFCETFGWLGFQYSLRRFTLCLKLCVTFELDIRRIRLVPTWDAPSGSLWSPIGGTFSEVAVAISLKNHCYFGKSKRAGTSKEILRATFSFTFWNQLCLLDGRLGGNSNMVWFGQARAVVEAVSVKKMQLLN